MSLTDDDLAAVAAEIIDWAYETNFFFRLNTPSQLDFLESCSQRGEAAFLLTGGFNVEGLNVRAKALLGTGLAHLEAGVLVFADKSDKVSIDLAIASALNPTDRTRPPRPFPLRGGGGGLVARILAFAEAPSGLPKLAQVAFIISKPAEIEKVSRIDLSAFGLSPRETELTLALASGETLQEHADARHISIETARAQLKACLHKLGVHRQSELVRFVLRLL